MENSGINCVQPFKIVFSSCQINDTFFYYDLKFEFLLLSFVFWKRTYSSKESKSLSFLDFYEKYGN